MLFELASGCYVVRHLTVVYARVGCGAKREPHQTTTAGGGGGVQNIPFSKFTMLSRSFCTHVLVVQAYYAEGFRDQTTCSKC